MSSETDQPRQRTVAELLAENGGAAPARRRRRRETDDEVGAEGAPGTTGGAVPAAPAPEVPRPGGRAARRAAEEARLGREAVGGASPSAPAPQGGPYGGSAPAANGAAPYRPGANGQSSNQFSVQSPVRRPPNGAAPNGAAAPPRLGSWNDRADSRNRQGLPGAGAAAGTQGPANEWSRSADPRSRSAARPDRSRGIEPAPPQDRPVPQNRPAPVDRGRPAPEQQPWTRPRQPWARPEVTGRPDPNGRPEVSGGLGLSGTAWPGETRERETEQLGRLGAAPGEVEEPLTAPFTATPDSDGGPPTQLGAPPIDDDRDAGGPPTQLGSPPLDDEDDEPDLAAPAGLGRGRRDADRLDDDEAPEEGTPQGWAVVIGQWIAGALVGAGIWVGFRYLWFNLPVVALAAAVIITVGLVLGVRALLRNDDLRTTVFAVGVGLLLTVSPAILVLLER